MCLRREVKWVCGWGDGTGRSGPDQPACGALLIDMSIVESHVWVMGIPGWDTLNRGPGVGGCLECSRNSKGTGVSGRQ